ncbi:MAG TPA: CcdB family protein [Rhodospirillaceae bacterium]|nr:CcdB family protein [Rhodospirillaceae bacterium]
MAQFDLYEYAGPNRSVAYLLDVQSDLLRDLTSRVVVPLVQLDEFGLPMKKLNPVFSIDGVDHVMATSEIAGAPGKTLGRRVGSLETRRHDIKAALDFLVDGY